MTIAKCLYCGKEQEDFKGVYYIKNDGTVMYFSSSKCLKGHMKLRRDKRRVRWTEAFHVTREKRYARLKLTEEKTKLESTIRDKEEKEKEKKRKEERKKKKLLIQSEQMSNDKKDIKKDSMEKSTETEPKNEGNKIKKE